MMSENKRSIDDYLQLPYTIEVVRGDAESGGWAARVVELPGCLTAAETFDQLEPMLEDAMRLWIATALEDRRPVPEPREEQDYSGKFIVRVPRWLHRQIAERAGQESISLNQYVSTALASAVSRPAGPTGAPPVGRDEVKTWVMDAVYQALQGLLETLPVREPPGLANPAKPQNPGDPRLYARLAKGSLQSRDYEAALYAADSGLALLEPGVNMVQERQAAFEYRPPEAPVFGGLEGTLGPAQSDVRLELLLAKAEALSGLGRYVEAKELEQRIQAALDRTKGT
jgi:antitoxin HicB